MKIIAVDESKAKGYLLVLAELEIDAAPEIRKSLNRLRNKGQTTIRFSTEDDSRKRQILGAMKHLDVEWTIISVKGLSEPVARELCLQQLVDELNEGKNYSIVLDRDESYVSFDKKVIRNSLLRRELTKAVQYRHDEPNLEKLLWLPDAIAWSYARGGNWRRELDDFNIRVIKLDA